MKTSLCANVQLNRSNFDFNHKSSLTPFFHRALQLRYLLCIIFKNIIFIWLNVLSFVHENAFELCTFDSFIPRLSVEKKNLSSSTFHCLTKFFDRFCVRLLKGPQRSIYKTTLTSRSCNSCSSISYANKTKVRKGFWP